MKLYKKMLQTSLVRHLNNPLMQKLSIKIFAILENVELILKTAYISLKESVQYEDLKII